MSTTFKFDMKEGECIVHHEIVKSSKDPKFILLYKTLCYLDIEGLLPKGYLTKIKNGKINYDSALKYCKNIYKNNNIPIYYSLMPTKKAENQYIVVAIQRVVA